MKKFKNAYKNKKPQINNLNLQLKKLEKKQNKTKPKYNKRKEMIKVRAEINKIENRKIIEKKSIKLKVGSSKRSKKLTNFS